MIDLQRFIFETCPLGPEWSALLSGYGMFLFGEIYITPTGEAYLASVAT